MMEWKCVYLVGGFIEKYEFVNGKDDIPYMKWKRKNMFQTTYQLYNSRYTYIYIYISLSLSPSLSLSLYLIVISLIRLEGAYDH